MFNTPAVLTETGLFGCWGASALTPAPRKHQQHPNSVGLRWQHQKRVAAHSACTSPLLLWTPGEESGARGAWNNAGTCSPRTVVRVWHVEQESCCAQRSRLAQNRGAGAANQHSTSEPHPSCNPTEASSFAANKDESVLPRLPLAVIIVSVFSCSRKAVAFTKKVERWRAARSLAPQVGTLFSKQKGHWLLTNHPRVSETPPWVGAMACAQSSAPAAAGRAHEPGQLCSPDPSRLPSIPCHIRGTSRDSPAWSFQ